MTKILYGQASADIRLADALDHCQSCFQDAVGLFYSPTSCWMARVQGTQVTDDLGNVIDMERVFEARIFNQDAELRWLNELNGTGQAVLLQDSDQPLYLAQKIEELNAVKVIDQFPYILWGQVDHSEGDWSHVSEARVGELKVPLGAQQTKGRIQLRVREYLIRNDEHGNVVVGEERLLGLEAVPMVAKTQAANQEEQS